MRTKLLNKKIYQVSRILPDIFSNDEYDLETSTWRNHKILLGVIEYLTQENKDLKQVIYNKEIELDAMSELLDKSQAELLSSTKKS